MKIKTRKARIRSVPTGWIFYPMEEVGGELITHPAIGPISLEEAKLKREEWLLGVDIYRDKQK